MKLGKVTFQGHVGASVAPGRLRWIVYGLTLASLALGYIAHGNTDPLEGAGALALPLATLGLAATGPAQLEMGRGRRLGSGFSPLVGFCVLGAVFAALGPHLIGLQFQLVAGAVAAAVGAGVALATSRRAPLLGPIQYVVVLAVAGFVYGVAALTVADVRFDHGPTQGCRATVTDRFEQNSSRSTTFGLDLAPWGPVAQASSIDVPQALYDAVRPGDAVCLTVHPGLVGIAWYDVAQCPGSPGSHA